MSLEHEENEPQVGSQRVGACPRCRRELVFGWCTRCGFLKRLLLSIGFGLVLPSLVKYAEWNVPNVSPDSRVRVLVVAAMGGSAACLLYGWWRDQAALRAWKRADPTLLPWQRWTSLGAPILVVLLVSSAPWLYLLPAVTPGRLRTDALLVIVAGVLVTGFGAVLTVACQITSRDRGEHEWLYPAPEGVKDSGGLQEFTDTDDTEDLQ